MTSSSASEVYIWIWLPGSTVPVVAGRLRSAQGRYQFIYGRSYLGRVSEHPPAISLYEPELPLQSGMLHTRDFSLPGCIRDAAPDAWGRRVIVNRRLGRMGMHVDTADIDELTYLLESGSDRIGALDFQLSPTEYVPRSAVNASLEELLESARRVEEGVPLAPELDQALFHASSIGGARPKALIETGDRKYIAKFSSSGDLSSVVKAEFVAMRLAELVGLDVAPVSLVKASGKDVLLIERFDRHRSSAGWQRKAMISALTILGLDEMFARYASYETLAEIIRYRFSDPVDNLKELFSRMVFNVLCGNTDDHARNHAAFWDGQRLTLTPAYDICPQGRTGNEASQAMLINGNDNSSRVVTCLGAAHHFLLSRDEALAVVQRQLEVIEGSWSGVCDEAELSQVDRNLLWRRQFLNPYSLQGLA